MPVPAAILRQAALSGADPLLSKRAAGSSESYRRLFRLQSSGPCMPVPGVAELRITGPWLEASGLGWNCLGATLDGSGLDLGVDGLGCLRVSGVRLTTNLELVRTFSGWCGVRGSSRITLTRRKTRREKVSKGL